MARLMTGMLIASTAAVVSSCKSEVPLVDAAAGFEQFFRLCQSRLGFAELSQAFDVRTEAFGDGADQFKGLLVVLVQPLNGNLSHHRIAYLYRQFRRVHWRLSVERTDFVQIIEIFRCPAQSFVVRLPTFAGEAS